ncbi:transcriptional regulator [Aeropyrum camini]|uniref:Predicted transcriptional regulator n=1 Tax=Aeropyrum camini SY1 = JCM 12091 TaxID=1198449 RepID=U3TF97_9CREN|nr:transcriptional regulator [Aeropyrum camini]BAN90014.1 predicted transcriptional regulator [Aeropyrum camini SY1 = JCM 12091]
MQQRIELPCEYAAKNIFPSIRASIAKILVEEYKMSKYSVAKMLGATPAAVSYYISGKRGEKFVDKIIRDKEVYEIVREAASLLVEAHEKNEEQGSDKELMGKLQVLMCKACSRLNMLAQKYGCPALIFTNSMG